MSMLVSCPALSLLPASPSTATAPLRRAALRAATKFPDGQRCNEMSASASPPSDPCGKNRSPAG